MSDAQTDIWNGDFVLLDARLSLQCIDTFLFCLVLIKFLKATIERLLRPSRGFSSLTRISAKGHVKKHALTVPHARMNLGLHNKVDRVVDSA